MTLDYSTVTDFARFRGRSTSSPLLTAIWYAISCSGMDVTRASRHSGTAGTGMLKSASELITVSPSVTMATTLPPRAFILNVAQNLVVER